MGVIILEPPVDVAESEKWQNLLLWKIQIKGQMESEEGCERFPVEENKSKVKTELQIMDGQSKLFIHVWNKSSM